MLQLFIDLFFTLIFVALLILLYRNKDRTFLENKTCFKYSFSGLIMLAGVALLQMSGNQGLLAVVPFLAEPVYRNLVEAIGIVAGITFLISGVSFWLPTRRHAAGGRPDPGREISYAEVEQAVLGIGDRRKLLPQSLQLITAAFNFDGYALFRLNHGRKEYTCTDCMNLDDETTAALKSLKLSAGDSGRLVKTITSHHRFSFTMPLMVHNRLRAVAFFKGNESLPIGDNDRSTLERLARLLSLRLSYEFENLKGRFFGRCWNYFALLRRILSARIEIRANLKELYGVYHDALGIEYFSLAMRDKNRAGWHRYSVGINGNILLDGVKSPSLSETHLKQVLGSRRLLVIDDVNRYEAGAVDSLFASCGQRNLLAIPILSNGEVYAVLTLGHPSPARMRRQDIFMAGYLTQALTPAIEAEISRRAIYERDRYLSALGAMNRCLEEATGLDQYLDSVADLIMKNIPTTLVRVATLDKSRRLLDTKVTRTIRPLENIGGGSIRISQEFTPWHCLAIQERRPLLINQHDADTRMDKSEMKLLLFERMQSALIVPIVVNDFTWGVITFGEMRGWDRFAYNATMIAFCRQVAARIAAGIKLLGLSRQLLREAGGHRKIELKRSPEIGLRRELKNPVTRLKGSLDLLRLKSRGGDDNADHILAHLEESTNRIVDLINEV